jgi:hypothetical protein
MSLCVCVLPNQVRKLGRPVVSRLQSVQGTWDPAVALQDMEFKLEHVQQK